MKRWNAAEMLEIGKKLFAKIHKRKYHANHNSDVHFMAREIDEWLPQGIQAMIDGTYDPRCLRRHYFPDEVVDQLHLSDRIFQHILLQQLKPTFKHVMNKNGVNTANWNYEYLSKQFIAMCWDIIPAAYAAGLLIRHIKKSGNLIPSDHLLSAENGLLVAAIAA